MSGQAVVAAGQVVACSPSCFHLARTSHLADQFIQQLKHSQPELEISHSDELCVRIAGLCHDLGHGPFSHLFEQVLEQVGVDGWCHEQASVDLFDKMLLDDPELLLAFEAFGLFESDRQLIKDLIYHAKLKKCAGVEEYENTVRAFVSVLNNFNLSSPFCCFLDLGVGVFEKPGPGKELSFRGKHLTRVVC